MQNIIIIIIAIRMTCTVSTHIENRCRKVVAFETVLVICAAPYTNVFSERVFISFFIYLRFFKGWFLSLLSLSLARSPYPASTFSSSFAPLLLLPFLLLLLPPPCPLDACFPADRLELILAEG